jgi:hypothetical protein
VKAKKSRCSISAAAIKLIYGRCFPNPFRSPTASQYRSEVMTFRSVVYYAGSGRHVPAFHHEHVQPIVEQESCLHIPVDKQLSFADDSRSKALFLLPETTILHTVLSAPTHSRYTPQSLRAQFRDFRRQNFHMRPCRAEKSKLTERISVCTHTHFCLKNRRHYFPASLCTLTTEFPVSISG